MIPKLVPTQILPLIRLFKFTHLEMYMTIVMDHFPRTRRYKPLLAIGISLPLFAVGALTMCTYVSIS